MTNRQRQRLKPTYTPLHRRDRPPLLRMDERGFIYLGQVKVCRFVDGLLTFQDRSGGRGQGKRIVEVSPLELAIELVRVTEAMKGK